MNAKRENYSTLEYLSLANLGLHFFRKNNCSEIVQIENRWSEFDMVMFSGSSKVLVEHKNRLDKSLSAYYAEGATIEKKKFNALKELSKRDGSRSFYVNQWQDYCFIWDITDINPSSLKQGDLRCPADSYTGSGYVVKPMYFLKFASDNKDKMKD